MIGFGKFKPSLYDNFIHHLVACYVRPPFRAHFLQKTTGRELPSIPSSSYVNLFGGVILKQESPHNLSELVA